MGFPGSTATHRPIGHCPKTALNFLGCTGRHPARHDRGRLVEGMSVRGAVCPRCHLPQVVSVCCLFGLLSVRFALCLRRSLFEVPSVCYLFEALSVRSAVCLRCPNKVAAESLCQWAISFWLHLSIVQRCR